MATEKALSAQEICAILRACAKAQVSEFALGGLKITFRHTTEEIASAGTPATTWTIPEQLPLVGTASKPHAQDELTEDDLLDQLAIENPTEWQRRQLQDELNAGT